MPVRTLKFVAEIARSYSLNLFSEIPRRNHEICPVIYITIIHTSVNSSTIALYQQVSTIA